MPTTAQEQTVPLKARGRGPVATAHDLLGAGHPLARIEARVHTLILQSTATLTVATLVGLAWLVEPNGGYAISLVAAAVVQAALAIAFVLTVHARRDAALRLIAYGRGGLPVKAVARLRRRLLQPQQRERLARSLEELRCEAARPLRGRLPLYSRGVVRSVDSELEKVTRLLRAQHVSPDGVAMALLVLSAESSPLFGDDPELLRGELGRVAFVLGSADEQPGWHWTPREG